ncbi:MAG: hypothetical protein HY369_03775 [Candidatus Aenigmarchaeota archaeon]|nr:hypothetical protein [Candidatus Aenigmarchaeota archaeon]
MISKNMLLFAGIVSLLIASPAAASGVDIDAIDPATQASFSPTNPYLACPGPLTPQVISVTVRNTGIASDTYQLHLTSLPPGWTGVIQKDISLAAGEEKALDLFLVNMPAPASLVPGLYEIGIQAVSLSTGEKDTATLPVQVLACHGVVLTVDKPTQTICEESGGAQTFTVTVENTGKFAETFSLTTSVSWADLSPQSLTLQAGEKKTLTVEAEPPAELKGSQAVKIKAQSSTSYASGEATLTVEVKNCYDFSLSLQATQTTVCAGKSLVYLLDINNLGNVDTFTIDTPDFVTPDVTKIVDLGTNKPTDTVALLVQPTAIGVQTFDVRVASENEGVVKTVTASVESEECRDVVVVVTPSEKAVCAAPGKADYLVTVKNTGSVTETFALTTTKGSLAKTSVALDAGMSETVALSVDTDATVEGDAMDEVITVTAKAGEVSDAATTTLTIENCYSAEVTITPPPVAVCPCGSAAFTFTLRNTGKLADNFTFTFLNQSVQAALEPGASWTENATVTAACDQTGPIQITAAATSPNTAVSAASTLDVKETDTCYGVELTNGKEADVGIAEGIAVAVTVRNIADAPQTFTLSLAGPAWAFVQPSNVTVEAGGEAVVYIYATPPFGTEEGIYSATLTSSSAHASSEHTVAISVGPDGQANVIEPPANQTSPGISLNITIQNITGEIIKGTEAPSFKTLAIGVITVIIVIILVVRFVILVRRK